MKDYSVFFKHPESFIKDINVDRKKEVIEVTFTKGRKFIYPLTKENLEKFMTILNAQYELVSKNKETIIKSNKDTRFLILSLIPSIFVLVAAIITNGDPIVIYASSALGATSLYCIAANEVGKRKELENIKTWTTFLEKENEIKYASEKDENITKNISKKTKESLKNQENLKKANLIDNEYNILFVDKANLKDLRKWLINLKISNGLSQPVEISNPKHIVKKRTKK